MKRKATGLLAAIVFALTGTLLLVGYVQKAEARAVADDELVDVLVVTDPVEAGTAAEDLEAKVQVEQVPRKVRAIGAVTDLSAMRGKVTSVSLLPGEQVLEQRFTESVQRPGVPAGMLEVTLALDAERALGGRIATGDRVVVVASFADPAGGDATRILLQKVVVTTVQRDGDADSADDGGDGTVAAPSGKLFVTLAVAAPAAERLVFAAEFGKVWLSAQPAEAPGAGGPIVTRARVFG